jgi:hypothetical protein
MYEPIDKKIKNKTVTRTTKISIALIPIIIILYLDIKYSSFSMNNLGVTKLISNDNINTFLNKNKKQESENESDDEIKTFVKLKKKGVK